MITIAEMLVLITFAIKPNVKHRAPQLSPAIFSKTSIFSIDRLEITSLMAQREPSCTSASKC